MKTVFCSVTKNNFEDNLLICLIYLICDENENLCLNDILTDIMLRLILCLYYFLIRFCPALKAVFEHGLKRSSILGGPGHPWLFIEEVCTLHSNVFAVTKFKLNLEIDGNAN